MVKLLPSKQITRVRFPSPAFCDKQQRPGGPFHRVVVLFCVWRGRLRGGGSHLDRDTSAFFGSTYLDRGLTWGTVRAG